MWFEPLKDIVNQHAGDLSSKLEAVITHLAAIASNTESELGERWVFKSFPILETNNYEDPAEIRNDTAYDWVVEEIITHQAVINAFLNTPTPAGYLGELCSSQPYRVRVRWYVPIGSVLFIMNESNKDSYVNLNIRQLMTTNKKGDTGTSEELYTKDREPPIPSGHPLGV